MNEYLEAINNGTIDDVTNHHKRLFNDPTIVSSDQIRIMELYQTLEDPTLYEINEFVQLINFSMVHKYHLKYDAMIGTMSINSKTVEVTPIEALEIIKYTLNR